MENVSRSNEAIQHEYMEESWEKRPKTDYTYSRSGSYSPTGMNTDYINPNMSRGRLKQSCVQATESSSMEAVHSSSMAIETNGLHTPPHTPGLFTVNRTESVSTCTSIPNSCTRSGLRYSTDDYRTRDKRMARENSESLSRSWMGGDVSVSNSNSSHQSSLRTYNKSINDISNISVQTNQQRKSRQSVASTHKLTSSQSAVIISQSMSQNSTQANYLNAHESRSTIDSRHLSRSRSHSPVDSAPGKHFKTSHRSATRDVCELNQSGNAIIRKGAVTRRSRTTTDRTVDQSHGYENVNQSASSSWLRRRSSWLRRRSRSPCCQNGNHMSHLYGLDYTDGEYSDPDECTMLYSRRDGYHPSPPPRKPPARHRRKRRLCPDDGPCGLCRVFRPLGCFLCSIVNLIVRCLVGVVMLVWCAVGGVLHTFIANTVLRDVWLLSKTRRVRRKCNFCYLLPVFIIIPLLLSGAYCVFRRGYGAEKFPLWSFFNLRALRMSDVNDQLDVMAEKLRGSSYDDSSTLRATTAGGGETPPSPGWVQHGVDYMQHLWAWETRSPVVPGYDRHERYDRSMGLDRGQIEAIVRAAVQKQLSDLGVQAGVSGAGTGDARFAQAQLQQAAQITSLQGQIQAVEKTVQDVGAELLGTKEHIERDTEVSRTEYLDNVRHLEQRQAELHAEATQLKDSQRALIEQLKKCCKNDVALKLLVRAGVQEQLAAVMLGKQGQGKVCMDVDCSDKIDSPFATWLETQFTSRSDMEAQIVQLGAKLNQQIKTHARVAAMDAVAAAGAAQAAAGHSSNMLGADDGLPTTDQVKALIQDALFVFDADKTGVADYALESSGGSVVSTRCSTTYHRRTAQLSLFGIPLWYASNSPRTAIQPGTQPGQCWAFRGDQGYLVIQLSGFVKVSAVSLEHIPKSLSPTGRIDSAPKDFTVWGLTDENDRNGVLLGNYTYREDKRPLQFFSVENAKAGAFNFVELQILSNHGNLEFTCLYRFRVHGQIH